LLIFQGRSFAIFKRNAPRHRHPDDYAPRKFAQEQASGDKISKIFDSAAPRSVLIRRSSERRPDHKLLRRRSAAGKGKTQWQLE
jgi:hypothetical protein